MIIKRQESYQRYINVLGYLTVLLCILFLQPTLGFTQGENDTSKGVVDDELLENISKKITWILPIPNHSCTEQFEGCCGPWIHTANFSHQKTMRTFAQRVVVLTVGSAWKSAYGMNG